MCGVFHTAINLKVFLKWFPTPALFVSYYNPFQLRKFSTSNFLCSFSDKKFSPALNFLYKFKSQYGGVSVLESENEEPSISCDSSHFQLLAQNCMNWQFWNIQSLTKLLNSDVTIFSNYGYDCIRYLLCKYSMVIQHGDTMQRFLCL